MKKIVCVVCGIFLFCGSAFSAPECAKNSFSSRFLDGFSSIECLTMLEESHDCAKSSPKSGQTPQKKVWRRGHRFRRVPLKKSIRIPWGIHVF